MKSQTQAATLPITEDDGFIAEALESASIPTLMMAMLHITGDLGLLQGTIRPQKAVMGDTQGHLTLEDQAEFAGRHSMC